MPKQVDAIYEGGVLKPLEPLSLPEKERVRVTISQVADEDWMDVEFMDSCGEDSDASIRLEDVRAALSKIRGSMDEAVDEVRGEY
jgi:predicted DNA-binding antitoxin AbrB/MazE fold protein